MTLIVGSGQWIMYSGLWIVVVYNLVGAFLGLATMLRGESLYARVDSQCAEKKRQNVSERKSQR